MNFEELFTKLLNLIQENKIPFGLAVVGLAFLLYGLISLVNNSSGSNAITFQSGSSTASSSAEKIMVDVEGAVVNPGVYKVSSQGRLQDGLIAAGGLSEGADRTWVAKNLNLAAKLSDGIKIYVPKEGEQTVTSSQSNQNSLQNIGVQNNSGLISINTASESELDALPGIGPVTAKKIISNRPYGSIDELLNKKIVSSKVYGQIKDKIGL